MALPPLKLLWAHTPGYYDTTTMGPYWRHVQNGAVTASGYAGAAALTFDTAYGFTSSAGEVYNDGASPLTVLNLAMVVPADYGQPVSDLQHFFMGGRFYMSALPAATTMIYGVMNTEGFIQLSLHVHTDGTLRVYRGINIALLAETTETLSIDTWYRIGFLGSIAHVNGWFDVLVDLNVDLTTGYWLYSPGHDTAHHEIVDFDGAAFAGTPEMRHCHMFLHSGIPAVTDRRRRCSLVSTPLYPDAVGAYTGWTPSTGATQANALDDTTPDDDATYVGTATHEAAFSNSHDTHATTRQILGAQLTLRYSRTGDATSGTSVTPLAVINSGKYRYPGVPGGASDWAIARGLWVRNPKTNSEWSLSGLNAAQWGAVANILGV